MVLLLFVLVLLLVLVSAAVVMLVLLLLLMVDGGGCAVVGVASFDLGLHQECDTSISWSVYPHSSRGCVCAGAHARRGRSKVLFVFCDQKLHPVDFFAQRWTPTKGRKFIYFFLATRL